MRVKREIPLLVMSLFGRFLGKLPPQIDRIESAHQINHMLIHRARAGPWPAPPLIHQVVIFIWATLNHESLKSKVRVANTIFCVSLFQSERMPFILYGGPCRKRCLVHSVSVAWCTGRRVSGLPVLHYGRAESGFCCSSLCQMRTVTWFSF